jgi:hypothetical protein
MEHKFVIPSKLLMTDVFRNETGWELFILGEDLIVSGDCTKQEAEAALAAHNPTPPAPPTVAEKLASVGLSIDDLKAALGV